MDQKTYKSFSEFEKDAFPNRYKKKSEKIKTKRKDVFSSHFLRDGEWVII